MEFGSQQLGVGVESGRSEVGVWECCSVEERDRFSSSRLETPLKRGADLAPLCTVVSVLYCSFEKKILRSGTDVFLLCLFILYSSLVFYRDTCSFY
jgi:hypothetical protein